MKRHECSNLLYSYPDLCVGCRLCEYACSLAKEKKFVPNLARIKIMKLEKKGLDIPMVCVHEKSPPCELACPNNAMLIDKKTGVTRIIFEKCTLCMRCKDACPYHIIILDKKQKRMLKCDFCSGKPACVEICPTGALKALPFAENICHNNSKSQASKTNRSENIA